MIKSAIMPYNNPCAEVGCTACCRSMVHTKISVSEASFLVGPRYIQVRHANPADIRGALPVVIANDANDRIRRFRYSGQGGDKSVDVVISGECVHLAGPGCDDYSNRPISCRRFEFGSAECLRLRKTNT